MLDGAATVMAPKASPVLFTAEREQEQRGDHNVAES